MKLWEYVHKKVEVVFTDGESLSGIVSDYTSALDNEPEPESIGIGNIEIFGPEIKSIREIE